MPKGSGGRRLGAGRPLGAKGKKKTYALIKDAMGRGDKLPLEVLLHWMNYFHALGLKGDFDAAKEAVLIANMAKDRCHPSFQAIMAQTSQGGDTLSELLQAIDGGTTGIEPGWATSPDSKLIN